MPESGWHQHCDGKRHNSLKFYGHPDRTVRTIRLRNSDGTLKREVRPCRVPEKIVVCARLAYERIVKSKLLVAHSGVALFDKACLLLTPEAMCAFLLEQQDDASGALSRLHVERAEPAHVAAAAALIEANSLGTSQLHEVRISLPLPFDASDSAWHPAEAALAAALTALAESLPHLRAGRQAVELNLGPALRQRRCIQLLVRALESALLRSTGLASLRLSAAPGVLRADDAARLADAAKRGWRARALVVLLGTHSRGDSPLQRLTTDLVRHILDLAAASSRVRLVINGVAATQPSSHAATQPSNRAGHASDAMPMAAAAAAAPPPPATLPASYAGRDLAMIANLV